MTLKDPTHPSGSISPAQPQGPGPEGSPKILQSCALKDPSAQPTELEGATYGASRISTNPAAPIDGPSAPSRTLQNPPNGSEGFHPSRWALKNPSAPIKDTEGPTQRASREKTDLQPQWMNSGPVGFQTTHSSGLIWSRWARRSPPSRYHPLDSVLGPVHALSVSLQFHPPCPPPPRQGPCRLTGELSRCIRKYRCMHFACMYLGEQTPGRMDACMHGCLPCMPSRFAHPCRSPTEAVPPALPQRMTWYLPLMFTSEHASS